MFPNKMSINKISGIIKKLSNKNRNIFTNHILASYLIYNDEDSVLPYQFLAIQLVKC